MECKTLHPYLQLLVTSERCAAGRSEQEDGFQALIHVFQIESVEDCHENTEDDSGHGSDDTHPAADHHQGCGKCDAYAGQVKIETLAMEVPHQVGGVQGERFENEHYNGSGFDVFRRSLLYNSFEHPVHGFRLGGFSLAFQVLTDSFKRFAGLVGGNSRVPKSLGLAP
jgi:hypothetical protein